MLFEYMSENTENRSSIPLNKTNSTTDEGMWTRNTETDVCSCFWYEVKGTVSMHMVITCNHTHKIPLSIRWFIIEPLNSFIKGISAHPNAHVHNGNRCNEQEWWQETRYPTMPCHLGSLAIDLCYKLTSELSPMNRYGGSTVAKFLSVHRSEKVVWMCFHYRLGVFSTLKRRKLCWNYGEP